MPFIIATSFRQVLLDAVQSVDAGEDQNLICDTGGTLTATVVGDFGGHTYLWEQISGTAVTFTSPTDQLSVTFTQGDFDDKVFRFTVDKGQTNEKFDEISVFGSPTFTLRLGNTQSNQTSILTTPAPIAEITTNFLSTPDTVIACKDLSDPLLRWIQPPYTGTLVGYGIQFNIGDGIWTTEATVSAASRVYVPLYSTPTAVYRVVGLFTGPNGTYTAPSNTLWRPRVEDEVAYVSEGLIIANSPTKINTSQMQTFTVEDLTGGSVGG